MAGTLALINRLPPDRREGVLAALRRGVIFGQSSPFAHQPLPPQPLHAAPHVHAWQQPPAAAAFYGASTTPSLLMQQPQQQQSGPTWF